MAISDKYAHTWIDREDFNGGVVSSHRNRQPRGKGFRCTVQGCRRTNQDARDRRHVDDEKWVSRTCHFAHPRKQDTGQHSRIIAVDGHHVFAHLQWGTLQAGHPDFRFLQDLQPVCPYPNIVNQHGN